MSHVWFFLLVATAALASAASNAGCIKGCKCPMSPSADILRVIDCKNPISLTNQTFMKAGKYRAVYFEYVHVDKIDRDSLKNIKALEAVEFRLSKIDSIDPFAFNITTLRTVIFENTSFKSPPILNSSYLKTLTIDRCALKEIPNLDNLPKLETLQLPNNEIEELNPNVFSKLVSLIIVHLNNNKISKIPSTLFSKNVDLNTLIFDFNPIESLELDDNLNLEKLSMKSCKLTVFDENISKHLDLVSYLDLSDNNIPMLPLDAFNGLNELEYLDLSNNKLTDISDDLFADNNRLVKLILDGNNFNSLPKFISYNEGFQTMYFSCKKCGLKTIEGTFDDMRELEMVFLSNNNIDNIDHVFDKLIHLNTLDLSNNSIQAIGPDSFAKNNVIKQLYLSGNQLKPLDPVVISQYNFTVLDISNCGLTTIWKNYNAIVPSIKKLYISKNNLKRLSLRDVDVTPNLKTIEIKQNPLQCNEELRKTLTQLNKRHVLPKAISRTHEDLLEDAPIAVAELSHNYLMDSLDCVFSTLSTISWHEAVKNENTREEIETNKSKVLDLLDEDENDLNDPALTTNTYDDDYYYDYSDSLDKVDDAAKITKTLLINENESINFNRATYIASITSVFVLTALFVLAIAVTLTLIILRRNSWMHKDELPRLKLPFCHSAQPAEKKHSGSVYRPLSEDISGSKTPIINRYEFKSSPSVHSSTP